MRLCLLLLLLPTAAFAAIPWDDLGVTAFDRAVVRAHLDGWAGPARPCFDAAEDGALMALCAAEAEDDDPVGYALIAYHAALYAFTDDDYAGAEAWLAEALGASESALPVDDPLPLVLLGSYATSFFGQDRYAEARAVFDQMLPLARKHLADRPSELVSAILGTAWGRIAAGDHAAAVPLCIEALADPMAEELKNFAGLGCMSVVAGTAANQGQWAVAAAWWTQWMAVAKDGLLEPDDLQFNMMRGNLGRAHLETSDYAPAVAILTEVRAAHRAAAPEPDPEGWGYTFFLARALAGAGRLQEAEAEFAGHIAHFDLTYGADSLYVLYSVLERADVLQRMGRYDDAEAAYVRAIAIGTPHNEHADSLNRYAELLRETGRLDKALAMFGRMEALQAGLFGPQSPEAATAIVNGANVLNAMGRDAEAKVAYERSLSIYEAAYGPDHPFVATALTSLATVVHALGDYTRAIPLYERAVVVYEASWGPNHRFLGTALNNLANARWSMGEIEEAHALFWRSFEVLATALGPDHPDVSAVRSNYATLLRSAGEAVAARDLAKDVLAASTRRLGADNSETGNYHARYADTLYFTREWAESVRQWERAIAITERQLGPEHPSLVKHRHELANMHALQGNRGKARKEMAAALALADKVVRPLLDVTSERERLALIRSMRKHLDTHLSLLDRPEDIERNYAAVLAWKGAVRSSLAKQRAALLAGDDPELIQALSELDSVRRELASRVFGEDVDVERVAALTADKERREQDLAQRSAAYRQHQQEEALTPKALCARLTSDEVVVDLLRYDRSILDEEGRPETVEPSYVALVSLGGACKGPTRIELGAAEPIDVAVARYRRRVASGAAASSLEGRSKELRGRLWDPIAAVAGSRETVWFVPDASLSSLPFGALMHDDGRFLVETHRTATLASAQDLLREANPGKGALVAGGVIYDEPGSTVDLGAAVATRSPPRGGLESFGYLAATAKEAEAVAAHVGMLETVTLLTGSDVSETRLRRDAPGKRLIHLATHGFFATGAVRSGLGEAGGMNPMLLSGVVLAGANVGGAGDGDDGILTAEEVVGLDLRGAELVVLSACETGLGEVADGEGVLGLRRAFALAGARSLVLSLWKVPDLETQRLMDAFYGALATESPADALRAAQLKLIGELRERGDAGHPFYWAAFVVSGR
jgi:CHAT domain-containing protein